MQPLAPRYHAVFQQLWWTPMRADAALAGALWALQVLLWQIADELSPRTTVWTPLWAALTLIPVVVRRRWLWPGVAATAAFILLGVIDQDIWTSQTFTLWVLAYTLAVRESWWRAALGSLLLWGVNDLVFVLAHQRGYFDEPSGTPSISLSAGMLINGISMLVIFLIGRVVQARRMAADALADRAAAAEANKQAHAEQAVADERRRIARELHDVVAHHVSVIGVMATGARRMLKRDPEAADQALTTIELTSRTTLRELRRLLFVLRAETETDAQFQPQPGLGGIRTLVDQVQEAGLPATLRIEGCSEELDSGLALTAYRIVQEALTNTLKHAGPASAQVRMTLEPNLLTIEVFDTGRGPRQGMVAGHGLVGMRERVAVYGGTLRTGPRPGGGFRVYAKIPLERGMLDAAAGPEEQAEEVRS